jgi:hypothetical protein
MLRFLLGLSLFVTLLNAKGKESCYTVQLKSLFANDASKKALSKTSYPSSCLTMHISNVYTVRCGCYNKIQMAKDELVKLKNIYPKATIATTYKYRFTGKKVIATPKNYYTSDQELKLMFQSFLYVTDLENAYATAKIAYDRDPKSLYWNQRMAEISRWSGRGEEALKYMTFVYNHKYSKKLQNEIIDYGLSAYQYETIAPLITQQAIQDPTEKNIDRMIYIYSQIGSPQRSAEILMSEYHKYPERTQYLTKTLQIYLDIGELKLAENIVKIIEKNRPYSTKDAQLISFYYYLKKDMIKSYQALLYADQSKKDTKYYELVSDIGWYLQKYQAASDASATLYKMNKARLVDYERIALFQRDLDLNLVAQSSIQAYKKYKVSYIFYGYAYYALKMKKFDELNKSIQKLDKQNSTITDESQYWIIKAKLYSHYKQREKTLQALQKALKINKNSIQIQLTILYFYLKHNYYNELKLALDTLAEEKNLSPQFYFSLASSYFYIQDVNQAAYYIDKAIEAKLKIVQTIPFKYLQAYIYQTKNNQNAFLHMIHEIKKQLDNEAEKNPTLLKNSDFIKNYLNASINIYSAHRFKKELKSFRPYLDEETYQKFIYNFATKYQETSLKHTIYQKIDKKDLWLRFSNAIAYQNHSEIEDALELYLKFLSYSDASSAALNDGQIALAQTLSYKALEKNDDSQTAYISHLNLSHKRSNLFSVIPSFYIREPLRQKYISLKNRTYLSRDFYLFTKLNYYNNTSTDTTLLTSVPKETLQTGLAIQKYTSRGFIKLDFDYHNFMRNYFSYILNGEYRFNRYIKVSLSLAKNTNAQESTQLLLGGKKDMIETKLLWNISPSTSVETLYQHNNYNSQDNVNLGSGDYIRSMLSYQIHSGYPDLRVASFIDAGTYNETESSHGVIDQLQDPEQKILPHDFYNVGVNLAYGMTNSKIYTRVWRPFFELSSYYNSFSQSSSYGGSIGYGGKVNAQDHLVFSTSYSDSVNGVDGSTFKLFLKYEFLYTR